MSRVLLLIRRDPATRLLPWMILAALASWICYWKAPGDTALGFVTGLAIPLVMFTQPQRRATLFDAALPIDGRDFLRARICSLLLYVWVPGGIALLGAALFGRLPAEIFLLRIAAGMMLVSAAFVLCQTLFLPDFELGGVTSGGMLAFLMGAQIGLVFLPAPVLWVLLAAIPLLTAALAVAVWPKAPLTFQYRIAGSSGERRQTAVARRAGAVQPRTAKLRALYPWQGVLFLSFSVIYPLINQPLLPLCFLFGFLAQSLFGVRWLATLPVSRRQIMFCLLAPYLLLYSVSQLVDLNFGISARQTRDSRLEYRHSSIQLDPKSPQLIRTAADSHPVITAPWGETYQPGLYHRGNKTYFNPWASGPESSRRFQEWQFRRATRTVYGRELPLERVSELAQLRPAGIEPLVQLEVVSAADLLALLVVAIALLPNWSRLKFIPQKIRKGLAMALALPVILCAAIWPLAAGKLENLPVGAMAQLFALRITSPIGPEAWVAAAALAVVLLWVIDREFAEMEAGLIEAPPKAKWGAFSVQQGM